MVQNVVYNQFDDIESDQAEPEGFVFEHLSFILEFSEKSSIWKWWRKSLQRVSLKIAKYMCGQ